MRYWNNTGVADWIRGTAKPSSATSQGWRTWEDQARAAHPYRFWIVEEGMGYLQKLVNWPLDKLRSVKYYFNNRFVTRTHTLTAHSLPKGQWAEFGSRVLHCNFDALVDFVEIESAWSYIAWSDAEVRAKYQLPWYANRWFKLQPWRCAAAGLDQLYWAAALVHDSNIGFAANHVKFGTPTGQAETAKETLVLYHWWKNVRPARPDPDTVSGWTDLCNRGGKNISGFGVFGTDETPEEKLATSAAMLKSSEIDAAYDAEDKEMLIRLVKLSSDLWT